ncbi:hypothetical protein FACS1894196_0720 [Clostridia bacterium]|nr:hypothetical protein FACS1894196_0650 [Clostridia bacterium]GHU82423.1 hypothetical protein FACS1894196_0720 [Clostridia bacterium]
MSRRYERLGVARGGKGVCAIFCALCLAAALAGCEVKRPDVSPGPTEPAIGEAFEDAFGGIAEATEIPSAEGSTSIPEKSAEGGIYREIQKVDVFLDATQSMMGFADTPGDSLYEKTIDAIYASISQSFPVSQVRMIRADRDDRTDITEAIVTDAIVQEAAQPSFYLVKRMTAHPEYVWLAGRDRWTTGERMNEFIPSYYEQHAMPQDASAQETVAPVGWAIRQVVAQGEQGVTVIVSDLDEIQSHVGDLTRTLQDNVFNNGNTIGLLAVRSQFSGFVPVEGPNKIWYEWGALPTGSRGKTLDYGNLTVGLTADESTRGSAPRPFYVLCIGKSDVVNDFLAVLKNQIVKGRGDDSLEIYIQVFDRDFSRASASVAQTAQAVEHSEKGINIISAASNKNLTGTAVQIQPVSGSEPVRRYIDFSMQYTPKGSDPRIGRFTDQDFESELRIFRMNADQSKGEEVSGPAAGAILRGHKIMADSAQAVRLVIDTQYPQGVLPKGNYIAELTLYLKPPTVTDVLPWVNQFNASGDQQLVGNFDGSRTIGLTSMMNALNGMQASLEKAKLGTFAYQVFMAVDE